LAKSTSKSAPRWHYKQFLDVPNTKDRSAKPNENKGKNYHRDTGHANDRCCIIMRWGEHAGA